MVLPDLIAGLSSRNAYLHVSRGEAGPEDSALNSDTQTMVLGPQCAVFSPVPLEPAAQTREGPCSKPLYMDLGAHSPSPPSRN